MSRWLEAAAQVPRASDKTVLTDKTHVGVVLVGNVKNPAGVKSVKSVLSAGGISGKARPCR